MLVLQMWSWLCMLKSGNNSCSSHLFGASTLVQEQNCSEAFTDPFWPVVVDLVLREKSGHRVLLLKHHGGLQSPEGPIVLFSFIVAAILNQSI